MFISRLRIANYKSFHEPQTVELAPGLNIVCGQNNSGKTSLLEALDPNITGNPHRSLATLPTPRTTLDDLSIVEMSLSLGGERVSNVLRPGDHRLALPRPHGGFAQRIGFSDVSPQSLTNLVRWALERTDLTFELRRAIPSPNTGFWSCASAPSFGVYDRDQSSFVVFDLQRDGNATNLRTGSEHNLQDIGIDILPDFQSRLYRFDAVRPNVGISRLASTPILAPNASNLAAVLGVLQKNTHRFADLNHLLHEVLPQVQGVSVGPYDNQNVQIHVWTVNPDTRRDDLTLPLDRCGTGISQVLAILYVAVFSGFPQTILIDEPQSFLHPGAIRKLIQVLRQHPEHQYIIATHSPAVISVADPLTITVCRWAEGQTELHAVNPAQREDLQAYLTEVGARLSDVFGADTILWVEGRTEELCFPLILEGVAGERLRGCSILSVRSTGELQSSDAERVFDLYNRLSTRNSLLPPAVGFIFDRESRDDAQQRELVTRSRNLLRFLPYRMYENYLLNPRAIAAVMNQVEGFRPLPIEPDEVERALNDMRQEQRYFLPSGVEPALETWQANVNGALILNDLFNSLSETRVRFDKVDHGLRLTKWIIGNSPDDLRPVSELIVELLPRG